MTKAKRKLTPKQRVPTVIGFDLARPGGDKSCFVIRIGREIVGIGETEEAAKADAASRLPSKGKEK